MPNNSPEPGSLSHQIRQAVASGEFSKARLLWETYGQQFRADILRAPMPQARITEARELAEWTRMTALRSRARAQAKLNQIAVSQKYAWPPRAPESTRVASF
jgi:hypothetical protein